MADALSISMGGRIASIYKQNTKRRRFTTVVNDIENKRLAFLKRQIESERSTEFHKMERSNDKATNSNDELKAFQIALLRRIRSVRDESKGRGEARPLLNLGRYGGATVEQIKQESEKYKRIRDPAKRRMIKARIQLEQGKRDGRIRELNPDEAGNLAESILQLYKNEDATIPSKALTKSYDVANLEDVKEVTGSACGIVASPDVRHTYPASKPRRLILPPLQIKRSLHPNTNYYRKISADYHQRYDAATMTRSDRQQHSPIRRRVSLLEDITERGDQARGHSTNEEPVGRLTGNDFNSPDQPVFGGFPVTSLKHLEGHSRTFKDDRGMGAASPTKKYVWNHDRAVGPVQLKKQFGEGQRFWKQNQSLTNGSKKRVVLPKIAS